MKRRRSRCSALVWFLLAAAAACVPEQPVSLRGADAIFDAIPETSPVALAGFSVSVARGDSIVFRRAHGFADVEDARPATPDTRFRIYSSSKSIGAVAAMTLAETGRLDLDAPISRYMPELPAHLAEITARQLMSHRSGIRHYRQGEWMSVSRARCEGPRVALSVFVDDPLEFAPGSGSRYSTFGYVLLSAVIEAASGMPFEEYVSHSVFEPAGMTATAIEGRPVPGFDTASFYYRREGEGEDEAFRETAGVDASCKFSGGGFLSTSDDLARFGIALLNGAILSETSLRELWTVHTESTPEQPGHALGFFTGDSLKEGLGVPDEDYFPSFWHGGSAAGGYSVLILYPEHRVAVGAVTNVLATGALIVAANAIAAELIRAAPADG